MWLDKALCFLKSHNFFSLSEIITLIWHKLLGSILFSVHCWGVEFCCITSYSLIQPLILYQEQWLCSRKVPYHHVIFRTFSQQEGWSFYKMRTLCSRVCPWTFLPPCPSPVGVYYITSSMPCWGPDPKLHIAMEVLYPWACFPWLPVPWAHIPHLCYSKLCDKLLVQPDNLGRTPQFKLPNISQLSNFHYHSVQRLGSANLGHSRLICDIVTC